MNIPSNRNNGKAQAFTLSIDRIDPNKGYVRKNIRLLCYAVNCGLNEYGEDVFKKIANAYINGIMPIIKVTNPKPYSNAHQKWDNKYREGEHGIINFLYSKAKKRSQEYGIQFDISREFISKLLKPKRCSVTNIPIICELSCGGKNPFRPSLDRIDNSRGYTEDNTRVVCVAVNYCLNEFGMLVFNKICQSYLNKGEEVNRECL